MDLCRNVPEPFCFQSETALCPLDDLFPPQTTKTACQAVATASIHPPKTHFKKTPPLTTTSTKTQTPPPSKLQNFAVPAKPRTKRKRGSPAPQTKPSFHLTPDPPLLHQAYWLADSELIISPNKDHHNKFATTASSTNSGSIEGGIDDDDDEEKSNKEEGYWGGTSSGVGVGVGVGIGGRRCTHCLSQRTPQWRAGPLGPKTLCNACGVRFKSGRLLPEYRPAKSPTFVTYKHSNSHKKVLEMRMASSSLI
ncbi:hypothetical protein Sjap_013020 [Stephania japonica]|uniref:GATA-type domain-containing protein n=1 Tax=Stephania japonica TaxID=461633 RepID=A0AAP0IXC4_9MAGN